MWTGDGYCDVIVGAAWACTQTKLTWRASLNPASREPELAIALLQRESEPEAPPQNQMIRIPRYVESRIM